MKKLIEILKFSSQNGLYLPAAYDKQVDGPSTSLLFSHIAFYVAIVMIIVLGVKDIEKGVFSSMIFATIYLVFYLLRRLSKVKFDLDDREINLESEPEPQTKKEEKSE